MKDISFQVDTLTLQGKLFLSEHNKEEKAAVLLIHGWESVQDRMFGLAKELSAVGHDCLTFDMRGHGTSEGDHTLVSRKEFLDDVVAAYDFLTKHEAVNSDKVVAIGSSFGAYLTALLSVERKLSGMVLRVPADYRDVGFDRPLYAQRGQWEHSQWKERLHASDETAALRAVHAFEGPILIIESEMDELIPSTTVQSYKNAISNPTQCTYVVMASAPHSISRFPEFQKKFGDIVFAWFASLK